MWKIQKISFDDAVAVESLEQAIFPDSWTASGIQQTLSQDNTVVLGAWKDECMVGYVIVYYVLDEGEIARIAVNQAYRHQGAASRLMYALEDFCREKGIKRLLLDVRENNETAIAFYRKCGFTEDGIRKNYYENPREDGILMSRILGAES